MNRRLLIVCLLLLLPATALAATGFSRWKEKFATRLQREGFSPATISAFLAEAQYRDTPLRAQARQPEKTITFAAYRRNLLTPQRIAEGRQALREQGGPLAATADKYGIEREVLAALWGIESSYGRVMGKQPVIASLATLAYTGKRRSFFERELIAALRIAEAGQLPLDRLTGSWAGAMGHYQFIPTTSVRFGTDGDGDARIDLCGSYADALASAGNYLHALGWQLGDARIEAVDAKHGRKMLWREGVKPRYRPAAHWKKNGLLPKSYADEAARLKLVGADDGRSGIYLVGEGFDKLREWNRSTYFALTILLLAQELAAPQPPAVAKGL